MKPSSPKGSAPAKGAMPAKAQGKGLSKMPPGIAKRIAAGKAPPAGIARTRAALLQPKTPELPAFKNGGKVRKYQVGGAVLPAQAAPQAAQGMARRPAMPPQAAQGMAGRPAMPMQAAGARPFKKGGTVKKRK